MFDIFNSSVNIIQGCKNCWEGFFWKNRLDWDVLDKDDHAQEIGKEIWSDLGLPSCLHTAPESQNHTFSVY